MWGSRTFFRSLVEFLALLSLAFSFDRLVGFGLDYMTARAKSGKIEREVSVSKSVTSDAVIFGSSRAERNYVPSILHDSLRLNTWNCGLGGQGILYSYAKLKVLLARHLPKLVIIDTYWMFDIANGDNRRCIPELLQDWEDPTVRRIVRTLDPNIDIKMLSKMYRYNNRAMDVVRSFRSSASDRANYGYQAEDGLLDMKIDYNVARRDAADIDTMKLHYFELLLSELKDRTTVVVIVSPVYGGENASIAYGPILSLCDKMKVRFIDNSSIKPFAYDAAMFKDPVHLNASGARIYSSIVASQLKGFGLPATSFL